jgi:hypothetical protein
MQRAVWVLPWLLVHGGYALDVGERAYAQRRFPEALAAFTAAEQNLGDAAPVELLINRSLAALGAGDLRVAELCAEKAAARGGEDWFGLRDFLIGCAAYQRAERAEAEAGLLEADPTSFDRALLEAATALRSWRLAAASRNDWPAARRNVERALLKLESLRAAREEARNRQQATKEKTQEQLPEPQPEDPAEEQGGDLDAQDLTAQQDPRTLSRQQLAQLFEQLAAKEREKRALRRAAQQRSASKVEKDW